MGKAIPRPNADEARTGILLRLYERAEKARTRLQGQMDGNVMELASLAGYATELNISAAERDERITLFDAAAGLAKSESKTYTKSVVISRQAGVALVANTLTPDDYNGDERGQMMAAYISFVNAGRDNSAREKLRIELSRINIRAAKRITADKANVEAESETVETVKA